MEENKEIDESSALTDHSRTIEFYTLDKMIERTGGFGRIQLLILLCMLIACIPTEFYAKGLPFLEQFPEYTCTTKYGREYKWTENEIWRNGIPRKDLDWRINWDSVKTINNWVEEMDLICKPKYLIGIFGSTYMIGLALSGIFLKLSDNFGRKRIIQIGWLLSWIIVVYLYSFPGTYWRVAMLLSLGMISFRLVGLYILLIELSPKKYRIYVSAGYAIIDQYIAIILPVFYFKFFGNDYKTVFSFALLAAPFSLMLSLIIPESPRYLYERRKMDHLKYEINKIAQFNKTEIPKNYEFVLEDGSIVTEDTINKNDVFNLIKSPKIVFKLIVSVLIFSAISFNTNLLNFYSKYLDGNGYDMAFLMLHAEIIGTLVAVILRKKLTTNFLLSISFGITSIFTSIMIFFPPFKNSAMTSVVGIQLGISMWFYLSILNISDNFPSGFVAFAFVVWNTCGSVMNILSPMIAETRHYVPEVLIFSSSTFLLVVWGIMYSIDMIQDKITLKRYSYFLLITMYISSL